jgi:hypothetical protein
MFSILQLTSSKDIQFLSDDEQRESLLEKITEQEQPRRSIWLYSIYILLVISLLCHGVLFFLQHRSQDLDVICTAYTSLYGMLHNAYERELRY